MEIRSLRVEDIPAVRRLGQQMPTSNLTANDLFWSETELLSWVNAGNDDLLVAVEDGQIVGFLLSFFHGPTKRAELEDLFVLDTYRKRGVGTALMNAFIDAVKRRGARDLYLVVRRNNEGAVRFYRKFFLEGFEFVSFGTEF